MTTVARLSKIAGKFLSDNAPTILTSLAIVGTVTTTVLAVRATPQAIRDIWDAESEQTDPLTNVEKVKISAKGYIPAAIMGGVTIGCIIGAHGIHNRRQAALISAYSIADAALKEYQTKVIETIGKNKELKVRDDIAKDTLEKNPVGSSEVYITGTGEHLCYDSLSGRYFKSDIETIRKAENDINAEVVNGMYTSQNDFYRKIGLHPVALGEEMGWRTDNMLDISFSTQMSEDNQPCICLNYRVSPIRGYWRAH